MNRKAGVIFSYILMIFEVLSTLLLTPFILRTLGQAEYGVFKLTTNINAYLLLLDLGVGSAIIRYIAKYRVNKDHVSERQFLGVASIFYFAVAMISVIIGILLIYIFPYVFSKGLNAEEILLGQKLLGITMINSAITLGTATYNNVLIAYEKFGISKGCSILQIIFRVLLTYLTLKQGVGSLGIVIINLFMTILCRGFFAYYVLIKMRLRPKVKGVKFYFIKDVVIYSSLILLQMIATQINASADQILLGVLVSSSASIISIYSVGTQIVQYFQSIGTSFTGILMPGVVKMIENGADSQEICDEMIKIGRIILIVLGVIWGGFIVFGKEFILLWAGKDNIDSYYVTTLLMTAYLFILTESVGSQVLWAKNEHKEQAYLKLGIVLVNIILTVLLVKWNPLIGATIGTFISLFLGDVIIMNIIFKKKIGISLKKYYYGLSKGILPSIFITIVAGILISKINLSGWLGLGISIIGMCVVYLLVLLKIGMNDYEKQLVKSLVKMKK